VILKEWRPHVSGGLRGYAQVELEIGLVIPDIRVLVGSNGFFVVLPEKPVLVGEKLKRDISTNKPVYVPTVQWRDRAISDKFSRAMIKLLLANYPSALDAQK
jgi:DNA-binding cell septation regulator SpoVG